MTTSDQSFQVNPAQMRQGASVLTRLEEEAGNIQSLAEDADPSHGTWGLVGIPFEIWYNNTADDVQENLGLIADCLGTKAMALTVTADEYQAIDGEVSDALGQVQGLLEEVDTSVALRLGPVDVARFDYQSDVPVAGPAVQLATGTVQGIRDLFSGDADWGDLTGIMGDAFSLGTTTAAYLADPFNVLISNGLGFLIDLIQPLEDALGWVTGNPERMDGEIGKWERVGQAQEPMAEAVLQVSEGGLATWQGLQATAAKQRFQSFAEGIAGTGSDIQKIVYILRIAQTVMTIAQSFVIGLIATFIEWLVFTWVPALAAAAPTFGGSTAAASAATTGRFAQVMARLKSFITKVVNILKKLRLVLTRLHRLRMQRVQASFQLRGGRGFISGWVGSGTALGRSVSDWRPYAYMGAEVGLSHVDETVRGGLLPPTSNADSDQRADQLDPDR